MTTRMEFVYEHVFDDIFNEYGVFFQVEIECDTLKATGTVGSPDYCKLVISSDQLVMIEELFKPGFVKFIPFIDQDEPAIKIELTDATIEKCENVLYEKLGKLSGFPLDAFFYHKGGSELAEYGDNVKTRCDGCEHCNREKK